MINYQVKKVNKTFGSVKALDNISLNFAKGITFILGDSGSGKSTLLNILGLLDDVTDGEVFYDGVNLSRSSEKEKDNFRAVEIGFVFQDFNLLSELTVKENLELAIDISNFEKKEYRYLLEKFKIDKLENQKVNTLSGGERQRVSIVRALLKDSEIILADEPTGNLDSKNSEIVFEALKKCASTFSKIVIIVTHNESMAKKYADRIVTIQDGHVVNDVENSQREEENEIINESNNKSISKKDIAPNIKFKKLLKLSYNNFCRKMTKVIPIALTIGIAVAALGVVLYLNKNTEGMLKDMNRNYLETDFIEMKQIPQKPFKPMSLGIPFLDKQVQEVTQSEYFSEVVPVVDISVRFGYQGKVSEYPLVRYVKINDFFKKRITSNDIEGEFIKTDNEVILGQDIAQSLFGSESWKDKTIEVITGDGNNLSLKVVGINHTKNSAGTFITYCSNEVTLAISKKMIDKYGELHIEDEVMNQQGSVHTGGLPVTWSDKKTDKVLYGTLPQKDNEIAIDLVMFNALVEYIGKSDSKFIASDFTKPEKTKNIDKVIKQKYLFYVQNVFNVNITGIVDSNGDSMIFCSQELLENVKKPGITNLNCYAKDLEVVKNFDKNPLSSKYQCFIVYKHLISKVSSKTDNFAVILIIISFIILFISVFMINSFVKLSILERTYEIGVLRSLGGRKYDIIRMFRLEHIFVGIFTGIVSLIIYIVGNLIVSRLLPDVIHTFSIDIRISLALFLTCLFFVPVSGLLPLRKINKMKPIDCIRNR